MRVYCVLYLLFVVLISASNQIHHCSHPDVGSRSHLKKMQERKFLLIAGNGAGIGNFLIFFPAAFYFAVLSGRV